MMNNGLFFCLFTLSGQRKEGCFRDFTICDRMEADVMASLFLLHLCFDQKKSPVSRAVFKNGKSSIFSFFGFLEDFFLGAGSWMSFTFFE